MTVIRVNHGQFSRDGLRAGDLIALGNFLEYIRRELNKTDIWMHIPEESFAPGEHIQIMHSYLMGATNYFVAKADNMVNVCINPGTDPTYPDLINLWNIRKNVLVPKQDVIHIHDDVCINAPKIKKDLLVIAPIFDAPYNTGRNWTMDLFEKELWLYKDYAAKKIITIKQPLIDFDITQYGFEYEHNYLETLGHISQCSHFIGGDSGLSHFAAAQFDPPRQQQYWYPQDTYGTTLPFRWNTTKNCYVKYY